MTFPQTHVNGEVWNGAAVTDLENRVAAAAALIDSPNVFSDNQTITLDAGNAGQIQIGNLTPGKVAAGGTGYYRPVMSLAIDGTTRWQGPVVDVGDSLGTGTGSRNGGSNAGFGDLVFGYRIDPVDSAQSEDFIYIVDERGGRIGFHANVPVANFHFSRLKAAAPTMYINDALASDNIALGFLRLDTLTGGIYNTPGTNDSDGNSLAVALRVGAASAAAPTAAIDTVGNVHSYANKFTAAYTAPIVTTTNPAIYGSSGSGTYPFSAYGHLLLQPRWQKNTVADDFVVLTGPITGDAPLPSFVVTGGPNYGFNVDPAAPTALYGGATSGILGLRNSSAGPTGATGNRPVNGGALWTIVSSLRFMEPAGSIVSIGNIGGAGGGSGIALSAFGGAGATTLDTKLARVAAGVVGISGNALTAPTMTGHALMLGTVTAAPSTDPVGGGIIYVDTDGSCKYRSPGGHISTMGTA